MKYNCKICQNYSSDSIKYSFGRHLRVVHNLSVIEYFCDFENFIKPKCQCGKDCKHKVSLIFRKTCGSQECLTLLKSNIVSEFYKTEEGRKKTSDALKKSHAKGNHPGWSHINGNVERKSYPEQMIKQILLNNGVYDKFSIFEHLSFGKYFLDFAIEELKLDIEVDGIQHYRTQKAIDHDIIRDEFVRSRGWKIYRICWKHFCNDTKNQIKELLDFIDNIDNKTDRYYKFPIQEIKKTKKEKNNERIEKIKNSNIDFSKFGWISKVSKILNITPQKTGSWIKKHMPELYERNN